MMLLKSLLTVIFCSISIQLARRIIWVQSVGTCTGNRIMVPIIYLFLCSICVQSITHIINCCIDEKHFLWYLEGSNSDLYSKKRNNLTVSDDLNLLPLIAKVLEKVSNFQFRQQLAAYNILPSSQSGFPPGYSTSTELWKITDNIINLLISPN